MARLREECAVAILRQTAKTTYGLRASIKTARHAQFMGHFKLYFIGTATGAYGQARKRR